MDFGALPPEINSAKIYAGSGTTSLLAAAAAWESLATDLYYVAGAYASTVTALTSGPWLGPASIAFSTAAAPYAAWLTSTAAQAAETARQVSAAAAAYEAAFAMTVPPAAISANRAALLLLMATNVLGQNTPAIAATEAEYAEMWWQDVAAMYGYAGACAAALAPVTPFTEAPETTDAAGLARQAVAASEAAETATANQLTQTAQQTLQSLAGPMATPWERFVELVKAVEQHIGPVASLVSMLSNEFSIANAGFSLTNTVSTILRGAAPVAQAVERAAEAGVGALGGAGVSAVSGVGSGLGKAASVGALSVPTTWAAANQAVLPAARALPLAGATTAGDNSLAHMLGGLPVGQGRGGGASTLSNILRVPPRPFVMPRTPAAG